MVFLLGEDKQAISNRFLHVFMGSQEGEGMAQLEVCPSDSRYGLKVCSSGLEINVYVFLPPKCVCEVLYLLQLKQKHFSQSRPLSYDYS